MLLFLNRVALATTVRIKFPLTVCGDTYSLTTLSVALMGETQHAADSCRKMCGRESNPIADSPEVTLMITCVSLLPHHAAAHPIRAAVKPPVHSMATGQLVRLSRAAQTDSIVNGALQLRALAR